jgi:hypothetical protein
MKRSLEHLQTEKEKVEKQIQIAETDLEELNKRSDEIYRLIQSHPETIARVKRANENRLLPFLGPFFFVYWIEKHKPKLVDFSWEKQYITEDQHTYTYTLSFADAEDSSVKKTFKFPAPSLLIQWQEFKDLSIKEIWELTLTKYDQDPKQAFVALLHLTYSSLTKEDLKNCIYVVPEFHRLFFYYLLKLK